MSEHEQQWDDEEASIIMTDGEGNEIEMVLVHTFDAEQQMYAVLLEKDNPESDGIITRIVEEDGQTFLDFIDDDEEWEKVVTAYNAEVAAYENE